jgi:hypothetical protein
VGPVTDVELTIDHLVLDGVSNFDAQRVANALQRELTHLLETRDLSVQSQPRGGLVAPLTALVTHTPEQMGVAIARAIFESLR